MSTVSRIVPTTNGKCSVSICDNESDDKEGSEKFIIG